MRDFPTAAFVMADAALASLFGTMSDSQFRQTYSQISAAAYVAPTPQTATYLKNLQSWSVSPAPSSRNTRARGTTKAQPQTYTPNLYQPPPIQSGPLPTAKQAQLSTYASRLRTGATLLVQPLFNSPQATTTSRTSRRGTVINYADPGSGDDIPDAGALDSDDSDFVDSDGGGTSQPQLKTKTSVTQPPLSTELDKSYLGLVPPSRFIRPRPIQPVPHPHLTSQDEIDRHAAKTSSLVPIRVEFETESHRIRDCFVWNLNESVIKPEHFAATFCNDLDIPSNLWADTIANQIRAQLEEHEAVASLDIGMDGCVDDGTAAQGDQVLECRVMLSIDVQINNHHLKDVIEWDLLSPLTPESFAQQLCMDLGLSGEAIPLVAHAVHEELVKHKRDAVEWGVIGASPNDPSDETKRDRTSLLKDKTGLGLSWGRAPKDGRGPRPLKSVWRDWQESEEFRTRFEELTAEEVERREVERERATRRLRRETSKFQTSVRTRRR